MLFVNISSDKVQIADAKQELFLDRNSIENTLGKALNERYERTPFQEILLLNGPGGFTNLRVGTLTLNLFNKLLASEDKSSVPPPLQIYSITKFELYAYLFRQWFLSQKGLIYIGQRDNIRSFDADKKTYEQIKMDAIPKHENLVFDYVCWDDYRGTHTPDVLSFHMTDKWLEIHRQNKATLINISDLGIQSQSQVQPEYMIEAVI